MDANRHYTPGEEIARPVDHDGSSSPVDRYADLYDPHFPAPRRDAKSDAASADTGPAFYDPHFPTLARI